jgi:hypothetical protein
LESTEEFKPLESAPIGESYYARRHKQLLDEALRGVSRGTWDDQVVESLSRQLDTATLRTVASWLKRARGVGMAEVLDLQIALQDRRGEETWNGRNATRFRLGS